MATPKKRSSKSKTNVRKKIWKNKAQKKVLNALNWANFLLQNLKKSN